MHCGLIVPADECGRRAAVSILGMDLVVRASLDMGLWSVGLSLPG